MMSKVRIRTQVAALAFILLPSAIGVVAIKASATCERFVRTYVTKPVRNRVSKETADAWAAWRIAHPNWKPNPNVHRPKYVMTRDESVKKVDFACSVPLIPEEVKESFEVAKTDPPPAFLNLPPMETAELTFPPDVPPQIAESTPTVPLLPVIPPDNPLIAGAVPEPATLLLVLSGMLTFWLFAGRQRRATA